jgi:nitrate reductase NapE component
LKFVGIENAKRRKELKLFLVTLLMLFLVTCGVGVWKAYGVERF